MGKKLDLLNASIPVLDRTYSQIQIIFVNLRFELCRILYGQKVMKYESQSKRKSDIDY